MQGAGLKRPGEVVLPGHAIEEAPVVDVLDKLVKRLGDHVRVLAVAVLHQADELVLQRLSHWRRQLHGQGLGG